MTHPQAVKMSLERRLLEIDAHIIGVHSVVVENDEAFFAFDVKREGHDDVIDFVAPWPIEFVRRDELNDFAVWLATPVIATLH